MRYCRPHLLFGMVGYCRPLGFLDEGGTFSLECPRVTAVFGQTVMVWGGVLQALPLIKPLDCGRGWGVYVEPPLGNFVLPT